MQPVVRGLMLASLWTALLGWPGLGIATTPAATPAPVYTLTYDKANKWVAPADNKPLIALLRATKAQQWTVFQVVRPTNQPALSAARLVVLAELLQRQHGQTMTLIETTGTTPAQTLRLVPMVDVSVP